MLQATFVFVTEGNLVARSSYFQTRENKQLLGYAFKRFNSASVLSCGQECLRSPSCSSTNFKFFSKKEEEGTCELNKHDVTAVHESNNFDYQEGAIFSIFLKVNSRKLYKLFHITQEQLRNTEVNISRQIRHSGGKGCVISHCPKFQRNPRIYIELWRIWLEISETEQFGLSSIMPAAAANKKIKIFWINFYV